MKGPWCLTREDLDSHFGVTVVEDIERVNAYFRDALDVSLKT